MDASTLRWVLLVHLAATLMMVGIIWFVQIVHYPLFNRVGVAVFTDYEAAHTSLITLVVMPLMFAELITAFLLAFSPPEGVSPSLLWVGLALVMVVWLATAFLQVPQHTRLSTGFDESAYRALVATNWVRTFAWTLRGVLVVWVINEYIQLPA